MPRSQPIDCPALGVARDEDGTAWLLMHDVSAGMRPRGGFGDEDERALFDAVARPHARHWNDGALHGSPLANMRGTARVCAEPARAFVAGLCTFDGHGMRPDLASEWVWLALGFGLVYHFTPKAWVNERALALFRRVPGVLLGVAFLGLAYGLMKLLEGAPRAFIYFQF